MRPVIGAYALATLTLSAGLVTFEAPEGQLLCGVILAALLSWLAVQARGTETVLERCRR